VSRLFVGEPCIPFKHWPIRKTSYGYGRSVGFHALTDSSHLMLPKTWRIHWIQWSQTDWWHEL